MANLCCPTGYTYINANGSYIDPTTGNPMTAGNWKTISYAALAPCYQVTANQVVSGSPEGQVTCPCCPSNYALVNPGGFISTNGGILFAGLGLVGLCLSLSDFSTTTSSSGSCPCCAEGYAWNSSVNLCFPVYNGVVGKLVGGIATIPCIPCDCTTPPVYTCPTCGTLGEHINFQFNFFKRNCTACVPQGFNPPKGRINNFLPNLYTDPDPSGFQLNQD